MCERTEQERAEVALKKSPLNVFLVFKRTVFEDG